MGLRLPNAASDRHSSSSAPPEAPYYEIDANLAERIRQQAAARGLSDRIRFVERTDAIEKYLSRRRRVCAANGA